MTVWKSNTTAVKLNLISSLLQLKMNHPKYVHRLDVQAYIIGYEVMTDGQISAYSVSYCSKKRDICMNRKEGSRRQR
jgi:hypothetical protein